MKSLLVLLVALACVVIGQLGGGVSAANIVITDVCACINGGTKTTDARGRCACNCPAGFFRPTCAFTANQLVKVLVKVTNTTTQRFVSSGEVALAIKAEFNLADNSETVAIKVIRRLPFLEPPNGETIIILMALRADVASSVVEGFSSTSTVATDNGVLSIDYHTQEFADPGPFEAARTVFTVDIEGKPVDFDTNALGFTIAGIVLLFVIPILEGLFGLVCTCGRKQGGDDGLGQDQSYDNSRNPLTAPPAQSTAHSTNSPSPEEMTGAIGKGQQEGY